jgi:UDP-N-acetyl-D-mannosaminuronic acid transferase (WecB/TagA/CpsF family)
VAIELLKNAVPEDPRVKYAEYLEWLYRNLPQPKTAWERIQRGGLTLEDRLKNLEGVR